MSQPMIDAGSFRDPSGHVYRIGEDIFRTVNSRAADDFAFVKNSGLLNSLESSGKAVTSEEVDQSVLVEAGVDPQLVLRHSRIPFVSYPYEWSFPLLKAAALHHLQVQLEALDHGVSLSDATAYNVQFNGPVPTFIDILSFRKYQEGEIWSGHRQFCMQFLNPLLLRALVGVPHNAMYRGNLEGIETQHLAQILPWWRNLSFNVLTNVTMQSRLQNSASSHKTGRDAQARQVKLPRTTYRNMLLQLHTWISKLAPKDTGTTTWQDYEENHTYNSDEETAKHKFIADFCEKTQPNMIWDLGCNTGEYSETALRSGAKTAIGFDFDQGALERAYTRATDKSLNLLPLFQDGANPSPDQGWSSTERPGVTTRGGADAIMALAFEHHLAIGKNIPLDQVVRWLVSLAPRGVIEFVKKSDETVQQLLALRPDIFDDYTPETFETALMSNARIIKSEVVSSSGRTLYLFDRS